MLLSTRRPSKNALGRAALLWLCLGAWGCVGNELTTGPNLPRLNVSTTTMPDGFVGVTYASGLAATGGDFDYTWSIAEGSLPDGLSLAPSNGAVTGVPTSAGTTQFVAQVNSGDGQVAIGNISITIEPAPSPH